MRIDSVSPLPHPVLGRGDDITVGHYTVKPDYSRSPDGIVKIEVQHELSNPTIEKLIRDGSAVFAVEINCGATLYRNMETENKPIQTIKILEEKLRDRCDLQFFVIAKEEISSYRPSGINPEYGDASFEISKGDVIAYGGDASFLVGRKWVSPGIQSIFCVKQDLPSDKPMCVSFGTDSIIIHLNSEDAENLRRTAKIFPRSYVASLFLPALVEGLNAIYISGEVDDDFPNGRPTWCDAIEIKKESVDHIKEWEISRKNILEIAQVLLDLPVEQQGKELMAAREQMSQDD